MSPGIFWFRRDLRLADNPALDRACASHEKLLLVYIDDDRKQPYDARRAWLARSLQSLAADIGERGGTLHVLAGNPDSLLPRLAAASGAEAVHVSAMQEPDADARDARLAAMLARDNVALRRAGGRLLTDPDLVRTRDDAPYRVFTPFFKAARPAWRHRSRVAPGRFRCLELPASLAGALSPIAAPQPGWDRGFWQAWTPGETGARRRLDTFTERLDAYPAERDVPAIDGTSRLSPHLHFGEISVGRALDAARAHGGNGADKFIAELGWREFAYYVLHHWPDSVEENHNRRFDGLAWRHDPAALDAWQRGRTGVPLVDAGMRQLWHEGWMHNRVRMVVASWLTKHMGHHWRDGAAWFMRTLVDADIANNALGWQWVAGTGVDAAPYFRIFNPVTQSRRFDPRGLYLRRWLPELALLDDVAIHAPWEAGHVPRGYPPRPMVDLAAGRAAALARLKSVSG
ncbi:DNA photolyase family protein [Luteimonas sp. 50]|uniref:DNA photolyase family protein n=1 Tax=Cognatiluteimonas sedimenti TaxID=2927791 RepID=A0ABT0A176_9GAMM|nr:deoxyribodipyrimidine photo-lyase [Lysobacter sedimenti]MCJ0824722.1 DNA photolyase family protein [Lysobacter sedimenti]